MSAEAGPAAEAVMVHGRPASLRWRRSNRARRIGLRIDPVAGDIVITLPPRGSRRVGLSLLREHEAWVAAKLAALPTALKIEAEGTLPICGRPHRIVHVPGARGTVIRDQVIEVGGEAQFLGRRVRDTLSRLAREQFSRMALKKAAQADLRPRTIRVRDTSSRWGSCAADGTLMFSWRLIMAPGFVQDYVVAHEVAHLRHMNHGPQFWALAAELTPYRAEASQWLNQHGHGLLRIT